MLFMLLADLGERDFLAGLYEENKAKMLGIAFHILKNHADAENALQEVFLHLMKPSHLRTLQNMSCEKRKEYLAICILNQSRDMLRERKSRSETRLKEEIPDPNAGLSLEAVEQREFLREYLNQLTEEDRMILVYHYALGIKYKDLAVLMNTTPAAVQKKVSRLRKSMSRLKKEVLP